MSENRCLSCLALQMKIAIQQEEIKLLNRKIARLEEKIAFARETAAALIGQSNKIMAGHSPRGVYAHAKGQKTASQEIDGCLM